jgi:hypothetical protein
MIDVDRRDHQAHSTRARSAAATTLSTISGEFLTVPLLSDVRMVISGCAITPCLGHERRAMEVDRRFEDLALGLVDGSIVALAESLGIRRLATRDVRHFAAVRLRDGQLVRRIPMPIGALCAID